jgi:type II secretory pathway pseudopilin PulG
MLALTDRTRDGRGRDDSGAVLVTVVVVMLVAFVAATMIAASVLTTFQANADNKQRTQAFIAAESGRDAAVLALSDGCAPADLAGSGTGPTYSYAVRTTTGGQPTDYDALATAACPTIDTSYIVIRSTGTGPNSTTATIDSVYRWSSTYSDVPGGVVTYFSGSVSQGVSHYTGDLVLRNGNWSCTEGGLLEGDLYVLNGTVTLSNNCTIQGDIYAKKEVRSTSQNWHVESRTSASGYVSPGNIVTDAYVSFTSNANPSVAGSIHARGEVTLSAGGGGLGTVGGTVTSMESADRIDEAAWATGAVTLGSADPPPFVPTLAWLEDATKWLDLDRNSGWTAGGATKISVPTTGCNSILNTDAAASAWVKTQIAAASGPIVLDFTTCSKNVSMTLSAITLGHDAVLLFPADKSMSVSLGSGMSADSRQQLFFVHEDNNPDDVDAAGDPKPSCGIGGQDAFGTTAAVDSDIDVMVYSPCGLNGTVTASFEGQLYTDDTTNFHSGSNYTCQPMSWPTALANLGCAIKGAGGVIDMTTIVQKLGERVYQTER